MPCMHWTNKGTPKQLSSALWSKSFPNLSGIFAQLHMIVLGTWKCCCTEISWHAITFPPFFWNKSNPLDICWPVDILLLSPATKGKAERKLFPLLHFLRPPTDPHSAHRDNGFWRYVCITLGSLKGPIASYTGFYLTFDHATILSKRTWTGVVLCFFCLSWYFLIRLLPNGSFISTIWCLFSFRKFKFKMDFS